MADAGKENIEQVVTEDWREEKNLNQCMLEMFHKGLWTDVKFKCMDHDDGDEVIKAHRNVLAARSPVFQAMFFGPCATSNETVEVKDKRKEILHLFLEYIYSDSVTLQEDNVFAVLEIAHFYQVMTLVQLCSDFLTKILTSDNACEVLTLAMFYKLHSLKDACCSFIDNHTTEVIQTEAFLNVSADCLLYILKGDTLYGKEEDILEAVEKWACHKLEEKEMSVNGTDIRKYLGESFYFLRLSAMSSQVLHESVSRKGYFSVEEYSDIAAFVGGAENVSVATNSSIARVPESEIINVNAEDGETWCSENLHVSFEITMLKSAFLTRLGFGEIYPYLVNTGYTLLRNHNVQRLKLPEELCFNLLGSVCVHDIGEQEFSVQQKNVQDTEVNLTKPILLEKRTAPYVVNVRIRYSSSSKLELEARCSTNKDPIISGTKTIKIKFKSTLAGGLFGSSTFGSSAFADSSIAGLKNIGFKHISSRD